MFVFCGLFLEVGVVLWIEYLLGKILVFGLILL